MVKSKANYKIRKDGKKDTGRPTSMTSETINKLVYAFSIGCSDEEACIYANIVPSALYRYQKDHSDFKEYKDTLKKKPVLMAKQNIIKAMDINENPDCKSLIDTSKWYLERKCKDEFTTRQEVTGADGSTLMSGVIVEFVGTDNEAEDTTTEEGAVSTH